MPESIASKCELKNKRMSQAILFGCLVLAFIFAVQTSSLLAQDKPIVKQATHSTLNEQQTRGEGLFMQRCSLCHLLRHTKAPPPPTVGPDLSGIFKDITPDQEKGLVDLFILKGTARMPGFKFALNQKELDDLVSFLKTL
jgi:mono/diheme cytochrome c family protein